MKSNSPDPDPVLDRAETSEAPAENEGQRPEPQPKRHRGLWIFAGALLLVCIAIAAGLMGFILRSPFGRTMIAIRENERRARFLGIPVDRHIWIAFSLSCFFMAFAGALYALVNNFADPRGLHYSQSGDFVMMAVMGGMRSFWGPLLGAVVFVVLQDYLSSITINWMSFIGMLFIAIVLFFPRGLLGFLRSRSDG